MPLGAPARQLTIADIRELPRYEETIDFKCVEGWSTVTQFAGARLSDFTARFAPGSEKAGEALAADKVKKLLAGCKPDGHLDPPSGTTQYDVRRVGDAGP